MSTADGKPLHAKFKGTLRYTVGKLKMNIPDVLVCPELELNLLAFKDIERLGYSYFTNEKVMYVINFEKQEMLPIGYWSPELELYIGPINDSTTADTSEIKHICERFIGITTLNRTDSTYLSIYNQPVEIYDPTLAKDAYNVHLIHHFSLEKMKMLLDASTIKFTDENTRRIRNCAVCKIANAKETSHNHQSLKRATRVHERLHSDQCGPFTTSVNKGGTWFTTLQDEYSSYCEVIISQEKGVRDQLLTRIQTWNNRHPHKIVSYRSDNGTEQPTLEELERKLGITRDLIPTYSPELNGKAEALNRALLVQIYKLIIGYPPDILILFKYLLQYAVYLYNHSPRRLLQGSTPYETYYNTSYQPRLIQWAQDVIVKLSSTAEVKSYGLSTEKSYPPVLHGCFMGFSQDQHAAYIMLLAPGFPIVLTPNFVLLHSNQVIHKYLNFILPSVQQRFTSTYEDIANCTLRPLPKPDLMPPSGSFSHTHAYDLDDTISMDDDYEQVILEPLRQPLVRGMEDSSSSHAIPGPQVSTEDQSTSIERGIVGEHPHNAIPGSPAPMGDHTALTDPAVTFSDTDDPHVTHPQSSPKTPIPQLPQLVAIPDDHTEQDIFYDTYSSIPTTHDDPTSEGHTKPHTTPLGSPQQQPTFNSRENITPSHPDYLELDSPRLSINPYPAPEPPDPPSPHQPAATTPSNEKNHDHESTLLVPDSRERQYKDSNPDDEIEERIYTHQETTAPPGESPIASIAEIDTQTNRIKKKEKRERKTNPDAADLLKRIQEQVGKANQDELNLSTTSIEEETSDRQNKRPHDEEDLQSKRRAIFEEEAKPEPPRSMKGYKEIRPYYQTRSGRTIRPPKRYLNVIVKKIDYSDTDWIRSMDREIDKFKALSVFEITNIPEGVTPLRTIWVHAEKENTLKESLKKSRCVVLGNHQTENVDYDPTKISAPVVSLEHIRILTAIASEKNQHIHALDIKSAYLNAELDGNNEIYVLPPKGYELPKGKAWLLKKAVYGLKQSGHNWYECLKSKLSQLNLQEHRSCDGIFTYKSDKGEELTVALYVDDLFMVSSSTELIREFVSKLEQHFELNYYGEISEYLGIRYRRNEEGIDIDQDDFVKKLVKDTGYEEEYGKKIPCLPKDRFMSQIPENEEEDFKPVSPDILLDEKGKKFYQSAVGLLQWAAQNTRPDICFAVHQLARKSSKPSVVDYNKLDYCLRYLKENPELRLRFRRNRTPNVEGMILEGFSDASFSPDDDRLSVTDCCIFLNGNLVYWATKRQTLITKSAAAAELLALDFTYGKMKEIRTLIEGLGISVQTNHIHQDNESILKVLHNDYYHSRRSIDISYKFLKEEIKKGQFTTTYIPSEDNLADAFTKALSSGKFQEKNREIIERVNLEGTLTNIIGERPAGDKQQRNWLSLLTSIF